MRAPFDGAIRRRPCSVVIRNLPFDTRPVTGERIEFTLDGVRALTGKVIGILGSDIIRVDLPDEIV